MRGIIVLAFALLFSAVAHAACVPSAATVGMIGCTTNTATSILGSDYIQDWLIAPFPNSAQLITVDNLFTSRTIAGPTITGIPIAPTAAPGTNTTQLATTAFDTAAVLVETNRATTAEALLAPKASPALTGTPTTPTAAPGTSTTQIASTAFVAASFAPLASPALTGTPTAPTAAPGTNTTQLATTAYVTAADVLLAPLASPALTGTPTAPTAAALTNTTQIASTAFTTAAVGVETTARIAAMQAYISGCQISAPGGGVTLTVTVCASTDSTKTVSMLSTGTYTKTTATWAVGSGNGMLDTGSTGGSASTWYHLFEIERPDTGVVDFLMSLSVASPTLPTNYTKFRYVASFLLDGSKNITGVTQNGNRFDWLTPPASNVTGTPGVTTAVLSVMTTPLGVNCEAILSGNASDPTTGSSILYLSNPAQTDVVASSSALTVQAAGTSTPGSFAGVRILTDTSSQIRRRVSSTTLSIIINTNGYIDQRGQQ